MVHLQLDLPEIVSRYGVHRTIEDVNRTDVFSRIDPMEAEPSRTRVSTPNDIIYQVKCTSWVRWNDLYDVYRATISSSDPQDPLHSRDVMIKFMSTNEFNEETDYKSPEAAVEAVYDEAALYAGRLSKIQSTFVPAYYGLFAVSAEIRAEYLEDVMVLVLEDVSEPIGICPDAPYSSVKSDIGWAKYASKRLRSADSSARIQVVALFEELHSHGIIIGDVERAGVCIRPGNLKLAIVDFDSATHIGRSEPALQRMKYEMYCLKRILHIVAGPEYVLASSTEEMTDAVTVLHIQRK